MTIMTPPAGHNSLDAHDVDVQAVPLRRALADELAAQGLLDDPRWRRAVETVPRHHFVPGFYAHSGKGNAGLPLWEPVTEKLDPGRWLMDCYRDQTLITQFDGEEPDWEHPASRTGGAPSSSSTLPSLVLRMWLDADLHDGHNVLEIGTGTGYSTALAGEWLGDDGDMVSIDVDPYRVEQAATALYRCGYQPGIAVADGLYGYWPYAPYDRIVAACSVRVIPTAWLEQIKPGGTILTTMSGWLHGSARALLTVEDDSGTASGPLLPGTISFMLARTHLPPQPGSPGHWAEFLTEDPRPARHGPDRISPNDEQGFFALFLAQLAAPTTVMTWMGQATYFTDVVTGAVASLTPDGDGHWNVREGGATRIWDDIEDTLSAWDAAGRPGPERFFMQVHRGRQEVYLPDDPALSFQLP
jgi:methyltransferase of ATP-grasp peptide maturase system